MRSLVSLVLGVAFMLVLTRLAIASPGIVEPCAQGEVPIHYAVFGGVCALFAFVLKTMHDGPKLDTLGLQLVFGFAAVIIVVGGPIFADIFEAHTKLTAWWDAASGSSVMALIHGGINLGKGGQRRDGEHQDQPPAT